MAGRPAAKVEAVPRGARCRRGSQGAVMRTGVGRNFHTTGRAMCTARHRIALYSHDTMGIGHMRRNMLIAQSFASTSMRPNILLICGAREAALLAPPPGVDYVTRPAIAKDSAGHYQPRCLDVSMREL